MQYYIIVKIKNNYFQLSQNIHFIFDIIKESNLNVNNNFGLADL